MTLDEERTIYRIVERCLTDDDGRKWSYRVRGASGSMVLWFANAIDARAVALALIDHVDLYRSAVTVAYEPGKMPHVGFPFSVTICEVTV